jgi:hypothetical protein
MVKETEESLVISIHREPILSRWSSELDGFFTRAVCGFANFGSPGDRYQRPRCGRRHTGRVIRNADQASPALRAMIPPCKTGGP